MPTKTINETPLLIYVQGRRGTGKSTLATLFGLTSTTEVMANYEIKTDNFKKLKFSEIVKVRKRRLIILDEMYLLADARRSGSNINVIISHFLFQSRKLLADLVILAQENSSIDLRFREMADFVVETNLLKDGFQYDIYNKDGNYLESRTIDYDFAEKNIFGKYDSYAIIQDNKDLGNELSIIEPEDKNEAIELLINEMQLEIPLEKWDKSMIKDFIKEKRYPVNEYLDDVYGRVKRILIRNKTNG